MNQNHLITGACYLYSSIPANRFKVSCDGWGGGGRLCNSNPADRLTSHYEWQEGMVFISFTEWVNFSYQWIWFLINENLQSVVLKQFNTLLVTKKLISCCFIHQSSGRLQVKMWQLKRANIVILFCSVIKKSLYVCIVIQVIWTSIHMGV